MWEWLACVGHNESHRSGRESRASREPTLEGWAEGREKRSLRGGKAAGRKSVRARQVVQSITHVTARPRGQRDAWAGWS